MKQYAGVEPKTRQSVLNLWLSLIGDKFIADIKKQDIRQSINELAKQPVRRSDGRRKIKITTKKKSNATLNRYKGTVEGGVLSWG